MTEVDLRAQLGDLLDREDERREWKANVADMEDVVETLCAFANDIAGVGGGVVVCGLREGRQDDGIPRAEIVGMEPKAYTRVAKGLITLCHAKTTPPVPVRQEEYELEPGNRRILVFRVARSDHAHLFKRSKEKAAYYPIRIGEHTKRANGDIPRLLEQKRQNPPFLERAAVGVGASQDTLDALLLRRIHRQLGWPRSLEHYLTADIPLPRGISSITTQIEGEGCVPRNVSLLFFTQEPRRYLPGAYVKLAIYRGTDKTVPNPEVSQLSSPLPLLLDELLQRLEPFRGYVADKAGSRSGVVNKPFYSDTALREALLNALVHRDYTSHEPVRVSVFADRIEILSPGGLLPGMSAEAFAAGQADPVWRNPSLGLWMEVLDVAQYSGQGIPTIIKEVRALTGRDPDIKATKTSVTLVLPASRANSLLTAPAVMSERKPAIVSISFGWPSILGQVRSALDSLDLGEALIGLDFETGGGSYLEPGQPEWNESIQALKESLREVIASPDYGRLHVFYRGPVSIAMVVGAVLAPRRAFVVYNLDSSTGEYRRHLDLDARFLRA